MELKWLLIAWVLIMTGIMTDRMYENKMNAECRIEALKANKSVEDISKICQ